MGVGTHEESLRQGPAAAAPPSGLAVEDDAGDAYLLALEEDEIPMWQWRWLGRILAWRVPCGIAYVGPHWYCSLVMLSFILGVGGAFCYAALQSGGKWLLGSGGLATLLSTVTFLRCALANPGVLKAAIECEALSDLGGENNDAARHTRATSSGRRCKTCNLVQPRGCSHCEFCQVCVEGFDHHCPWMGKCIGRGNMCAFQTFLAVSLSSLAYVLFATIMCTPAPEDPAFESATTGAPPAAAAATEAVLAATNMTAAQ